MLTLILLWEASLLLVAIGSLALAALLLLRTRAHRHSHARAEARRRLLPQLFAGDPHTLSPVHGFDLEVAASLTGELAEMTRGSERDALMRRASALGVPVWLNRRLAARRAQDRMAALEALSYFEEEIGAVWTMLDDRNPDVRLAAALILAQRDDGPDARTLIAKLKVGQEENSLLLVSLLADMARRDPDAVADLLYDPTLPYAAKVVAIDALAQSGADVSGLLAYMAEGATGETDLQPRLFRALGRSGDPAAARIIESGLASEEWPVRAAAAEAAGRTGLRHLADRLGDLMDDEAWWVRTRAGEALLRLGPAGLTVLHRIGDDGNEAARGAALATLAERNVA